MRDRDYIPKCIAHAIPHDQKAQYQEYGLQRAKFNIFMIVEDVGRLQELSGLLLSSN